MDETNFIGLQSTHVNLLLCHLTGNSISSILIRLMKQPHIDWQTVQKYIRFHKQDENRDSRWLIHSSKCWQKSISSLSIKLMQY